MEIKKLFMCLAASVAVFASCQVDNALGVFEAPVSPYAGATVLDPVTKDISVRFNQKYKTVDLTLSELGLAPAEEAVFYAPHNDSTDWCGADWYTAEYGFYMTGEGKACQRSTAGAKFFVEYYPESQTIAVGQIPDACKAGETYTLEFGFATKSEKQPVKLTVFVKEQLPWATSMEHPDGLTYTVYEEVNTEYTALEIPVNEDAVKAALGISSLRPLTNAMKSDVAYDNVMRGVNADGSYDDYQKYTANTGYWYDRDGNVCEWMGENWGAFVEWDYNVSPMTFRLGQAVENNVVGDRYDLKVALILEGKEALLTFKLKLVEEVTDDLGLLE